MKCQKCQSENIIELNVKSPDRCKATIRDKNFSYLADIKGILEEGEYVVPKICLDCGQCQGDFPKDSKYILENSILQRKPRVPAYKEISILLSDLKNHRETCNS